MSVRRHGEAPFEVAVLHGGPGGAGEVAPLARALAARGFGVLEPLQAARSVEGQVAELHDQIGSHGSERMVVVGWSWGAWLGCLHAARHPGQVRRLILISSGPFDEAAAMGIQDTRLSRLPPEEAAELKAGFSGDVDLPRLLAILHRADGYDPDPTAAGTVDFDPEIFAAVWGEAAAMRRSGALLEQVARIDCPVACFHGDHDPGPAEGVRAPLAACLPEFRFQLLEKCGHTPWIERQAASRFLDLLDAEIRADGPGPG